MGSPALVGLDVGTTGVKALALSVDGEVRATATRGYELSTPRPGWAEQDPERLVARRGGRARRGHGGPRRGGDRPLRPDARPRRARRRRPGDPPGDPLERPAHGDGVRRDRGARRARPPDRAHGQPGAHGLHRARSCSGCAGTSRRRTGASRASCCRRTTSACASPASGRSTRRTRPGRSSSTSSGATGAARCSMRSSCRPSGCRPSSSPPTLRDTSRGTPVAAGAGDQPAAAVGVGVDRSRERSPSCSGRPASSSRRCPPTRTTPRRASTPSATPCPGHLAGDGRDALGCGFAAVAPRRRRARACRSTSWSRRPTAWGPGAEGLLFLPYLAGERTPHADPDARGAFVGLELRHDRGALVRAVLEGVAFGLRDSLDLLRPLGVEAPRRPRVRRRCAEPRVASDRRVRARSAARADRVRGGLGLRCRPSRRRGRRRLRRRGRGGRRCVRVTDTIEPDPSQLDTYAELHARYRALYPALREVRLRR